MVQKDEKATPAIKPKAAAKPAKKATAKKAPAKRAAARKPAAKKAPARRKAAAPKAAPAKPKVAKKPAAKKAPVRRAAVKKSPVKRTTRGAAGGRKNNGANGNYYDVKVAKPLLKQKPYTATMNDIIVATEMTHAEGELLCALVRRAQARKGNMKPGPGGEEKYNRQKISFYSETIVNS